MTSQPFAYIAFYRQPLADYWSDAIPPTSPRLVAVRPMLREIVTDRYLRSLARWPDDRNLEIIECYPDGHMENVTLDRFANTPATRRHIHWTWRW